MVGVVDMSRDKEVTYLPIVNREGFDLVVYQCGMEKCKSSHSWGPAVRDHYLIHFILKGSGTFYVDGKVYNIKENGGFLICPDTITSYIADKEDPWIYAWVGFRGIKAESYLSLANLSSKDPVFKSYNGDFVKKCFEDMRRATELKYGKEFRLQALLTLFLSELIEERGKNIVINSNYRELYLKKSLQFIETNYHRKITVSEIAESVGLNKNYFSTFFRENMGLTPQEYLVSFRINKACELMNNEVLTISDISRSVGYNDPLGFSKIFKKVKGFSPKNYRINLKQYD